MPRATKPLPAAAALAPSPHNLFVGTSGWAYPTWKPGFYPKEIPAHSFLPFYGSKLTSVEVNYTFRMLPSASQLSGWLNATPPGFRFSFKAPQRITHFARLRGCEAALEAFLEAIAPAASAGKLGPVLFQLPPNFPADTDRLAGFLSSALLRGPRSPAIAFEFRHETWFEEPVLTLLRAANVALCVAESEDLRTPDVATASHRYYRLRCPGGYTDDALKRQAARLVDVARRGETFVYLKHEDQPTGALSACKLLAYACCESQSRAAEPKAG